MTTPLLYLLHEGESGDALARVKIVEGAAARAGIAFVTLDSRTFDYSAPPSLRAGDMLFNVGRGGMRLEALLMRPFVAGFRAYGPTMVTNGDDTTLLALAHEQLGMPQPRTIHRLPATNDALPSYVDALNGFPLVLKQADGTLGVGVMIVESMRSLRSIVDFLRTTGHEFILREYIEPQHVGRLCVLGGRVVASLKYAIDPDDFRGLPYRSGGSPMSFGARAETLAIDASRAAGHDFTGVDILIDKAGDPWLLEVNGPSNFVAYERDLGIPIGDMIVAHLKARSDAVLAAREHESRPAPQP